MKPKKNKIIECQRCSKKLPEYLMDSHHYPISKKDGGTEIQMWCKKCHDEFHGIVPDMNIMKQHCENFYMYQRMRIVLENKIRAYVRLDVDEKIIESIKLDLDKMKKIEKDKEKQIKKMVKELPIWNDFLKDILGIGYIYAGNLVGIIGNIKRFETVSSLWKYAGLDVQNGKAPCKKKKEKITYNPKLKTLCLGKIADNFVKVSKKDSKYGKLYVKFKAEEKEKHPEEIKNPAKTGYKKFYTKGHLHRRAKRKAVKEFIKDFHVEWSRPSKI